VKVSCIRPSPPLQEFVGHYLYRESSIPDGVIVRPLLARADPFVAFHLRDRYEVFEHAPSRTRLLPPAYVVGPQTRRVADLLLRGSLRVFFISFRPTGLHRLFGVPMADLTDHAYEASHVMGPEATALHERLLDCASISDIVRAAEQALTRVAQNARPLHPIERAATTLIRTNGQTSLTRLAHESGVGERQFERNFAERVGVGPKRYARIARLTFALQTKQRQPALTWTDVSQRAGYFDQTHLIRDFKALVGANPSAFLRSLDRARTFFPPSPAETLQASDFY
jgi:AraC-like DNA-binding protein